MVINNILFGKDAKKVTVSAEITFTGSKSEKMYLCTQAQNYPFVSTDASCFLAAVLLPCMKTGEDISIEGTVSELLLANTLKIMDLVASWNIDLKKIAIHARATQKDTGTPQSVGSFFSGGVDSFYTYLKHKKSKTNTITDLLLVHGFDIPLQNTLFFENVRETVEKITTDEHINAIFVETNIADIVEKKLVWDFAHGGALAAVALFLRKKFKTIFIPGAVQQEELFPYGTHPDLDILWSTETLTIEHDGTEYNRLGKILHGVAQAPLAQRYLRVCTQNIKGKYNCSHCYKCLITMLYLICAGTLDKFQTFDRSFDLTEIKNMYYDYALKYNQQGEAALFYLKEHHREPALQEAIEYSLEKSKHPKLGKRIMQLLAAFDQKYNDRRGYRFIFQMNKFQDRSFLFKILQKRGLLK